MMICQIAADYLSLHSAAQFVTEQYRRNFCTAVSQQQQHCSITRIQCTPLDNEEVEQHRGNHVSACIQI
jgi:hypothetical protein